MKRTSIIFALMWLTVSSWAQQLTEQEAKDRALQYLGASPDPSKGRGETEASPDPSKGRGERSFKAEGRKMTSAKVGAKKIYAFNREGGGFVIASGDSRALPVLGYSDSGSIDWERLPENMQAWLMQYDEAIATLGDRTDFKDGNLLDGDGKALARTRTARTAIEPLIKTRWSQAMAPYDDMCPLYAGHNPEWQGQRCWAGCGAVALAQVLNYWQWPKSLPDGLPAYESIDLEYDASLSWHIDALPPVTFDWENMLDEYAPFNYSTRTYDLVGTEVQQQAVATLLRYCGQALESMYSPVGTSSDFVRCRNALVKHFGYAAATRVKRQQFGIDEWEEMVYTELAAGRPIMYRGISPTADGHGFVCDGYDGDGLFHINWGWQGLNDGYYSLSVLNPLASTNPNKGSESLGFTQQQGMIIGLDPSLKELEIPLSDKSELWQYKRMNVLSENTVIFHFLYNHDAAGTAAADYALGTIEAVGTLTPRFIGDPNDSIIYNNNGIIVEIDSTAFQPGETLRLHPMLRFRHVPEAEWKLIPPDTIYVDAGRREDGTFFIANEPYQLEYAGAAITSGLGRIGGKSDLTVTIRNHEQTDYVEDIKLLPRYYGHIDEADITADTPYTEGEELVNGAYLRAGQEDEVTFLFTPKQGGLVWFDLYSGNDNYFGSFTMRFDTIYSYEPYLVNNSYVTHEGNHYVYHVELCDRPGVAVPDGVLSDSIYFHARISSSDDMFTSGITIEDEVRDYLRALPDSAGSGNYKFTAEVSLDIEQDGEYYVRSYLIEWLNAEHTEGIQVTFHSEVFPVTVDPSAIKGVDGSLDEPDAPIYDLQGRKVISHHSPLTTPLKKGIYIRQGKKYIK